MTAMLKEAQGSFAPLRQKLLRLGVHENDLGVILSRIRTGPRLQRGDNILAARHSANHLTVLMDGIACLYERLTDGSRQIYSFQYAGDFCDLGRHVLEATEPKTVVGAVTECRIGYLENRVLDQLLVQYPSFGTALWRSCVIETGALRATLLSSRQPALQCVAHLLCEQLARQSATGIDEAIIPISQVDLADAAGLSVVHVNRVFQELLAMNLLSKVGRYIMVVDRGRLARLGNFDGRCLDMPKVLSSWNVKI